MSLYSRIADWLFPDDMFDVFSDEEVEHASAGEVPVVHREDQAQHEDSRDADTHRDGP